MIEQTTEPTCCAEHRERVAQAVAILSGEGVATVRESLVLALLTGQIATSGRQ